MNTALLSEPKTKKTIKRNDSEKKGGRTYTLPDGEIVPSVTSILGVIAKPALVAWSAKVEREMVIAAAADLYNDLPVGGQKMLRMAYVATLEKRVGYEKANSKILTAAGNIGTQIHNLIEWNLKKELGIVPGPEPKVKDKALWGFMVYEEWRKKVSFKPRAIEQQVWSRRHKHAGTTDWLADLTLDEEYAAKWGAEPGTYLTVGDWKSGKAIYDEALMQVAAYIMSLIEMGHAEPPINGCIVRLPKVETDPEPDVLVIPWRYIPYLYQSFLAANALFNATKAIGGRAKEELPVIAYDRVWHLGAVRIECSADAPIMAKQAEEETAKPEGNGVPTGLPPTHAPFVEEPVGDDPFAPVKPEQEGPRVVDVFPGADDDMHAAENVSPVKVRDEVPVIPREEYNAWLDARTATHKSTVKKVAEILHLPGAFYDQLSPTLMSAFKLSVDDRIALDERTAAGKPTKARRNG